MNFPADEHLMIYTYRNFISTFLQMNTLWYIHTVNLDQFFLQMNTWWYILTATLYKLFCRWTPDDIYIPNFISIFQQINIWWYIHTATLYQLSCRLSPDDICIPQLFINFPAVKHLMIYTYGNFIWIFQQMNTWWYIHTATLYQLSCRWSPDDIYIP